MVFFRVSSFLFEIIGGTMFDIKENLRKLPEKPGVYIMRDENNTILYVGKAINLKRRVSSYFRKTRKSSRIEKMVTKINHFEYGIKKK